MYSLAVDDAQQEEELLRKTLDKINEIRSIRNERRIQVGIIINTNYKIVQSNNIQ
jgi:hypothetical protein